MTATPFNPALIIVDVQEDFLPPTGSLAVKNGRDIIPGILELMDLTKYNWKTIIATKDWHPKDHISFASNHENTEPYDTINIDHPLGEKNLKTGQLLSKPQVLWPDHCIQNEKGSEFPQELQEKWDEIASLKSPPSALVKKGYLQDREYYSCFQDIWQLHHTECESFLKQNGITHVFTVGIAYDFCVLNSSIDSAKAGFTTYVIRPLTKSVYPSNVSETDSVYLENNVQIIRDLEDDNLKQVQV